MRESWFLRQLQHPNIAHLLHQYMSPNSVPSERDPRDQTCYFIQVLLSVCVLALLSVTVSECRTTVVKRC